MSYNPTIYKPIRSSVYLKVNDAMQELLDNTNFEKFFDQIYKEILYIIRDGFKNCLGCQSSLWLKKVKSNQKLRSNVLNKSCYNVLVKMVDSVTNETYNLYYDKVELNPLALQDAKSYAESKFYVTFLRFSKVISYDLLVKPVVDAFIYATNHDSILPWNDSVLIEKFLYKNFSIKKEN